MNIRALVALITLVVLPACSASPDAVIADDEPAPTSSSASPTAPASPSASPTAAAVSQAAAEQLIQQFRAFAQEPSAAAAEELPFAPKVQLGLGDTLVKETPAAELGDPAAWSVPTTQDLRWTGLPSLNLLEPLTEAEEQSYVTTIGTHPRCAAIDGEAPSAVADHVRVSTQPAEPSSCPAWYSVDLFIQDDKIHAVTLDLYEP